MPLGYRLSVYLKPDTVFVSLKRTKRIDLFTLGRMFQHTLSAVSKMGRNAFESPVSGLSHVG